MGAKLRVDNVSKNFGGLAAVKDLDLVLEPSIVTALIGPNGAGKTTIFNLMTGNIIPDVGKVYLDDKPITGLSPHAIARLGIGRTFQGLNLFDHMTVRENVETALEPAAWFWQAGGRSFRRSRDAAVSEILEEVGLQDVSKILAGNLSFAQRKFLSMARLKALRAKVWLLDEPASGLDPSSRGKFSSIVKDAARSGITICLIEHNLDLVLELAQRIVFLDRGTKLAEGLPEVIVQDPKLADVYFGGNRK
jgi:ABC-type branched-subunit amino acid transport system ATPase component